MTTTQDLKAKYFMEDVREKRRLVEKVDPQAWVSRYLAPRLGNAARILDVGCGPAALARAAAEHFTGASVVGLEQSNDRFQEAGRNLLDVANAEVVRGNACSMPFEADDPGLSHLPEILMRRR